MNTTNTNPATVTVAKGLIEFNSTVLAGIVFRKEDKPAIKEATEKVANGQFLVPPDNSDELQQIGISDASQSENLLELQKELIKLVKTGKMGPICLTPAVPQTTVTDVRMENGVVKREFPSHLGLPVIVAQNGRKEFLQPRWWYIGAEIGTDLVPRFTCWQYVATLDRETGQWCWKPVLDDRGEHRCAMATGDRVKHLVGASWSHMDHFVVPLVNKARELAKKEAKASTIVAAAFTPPKPRPLGTIGDAMAAKSKGAHQAA
ncbi:MAG: hypothetical protein WCL61_02785 [bacterium]